MVCWPCSRILSMCHLLFSIDMQHSNSWYCHISPHGCHIPCSDHNGFFEASCNWYCHHFIKFAIYNYSFIPKPIQQAAKMPLSSSTPSSSPTIKKNRKTPRVSIYLETISLDIHSPRVKLTTENAPPTPTLLQHSTYLKIHASKIRQITDILFGLDLNLREQTSEHWLWIL